MQLWKNISLGENKKKTSFRIGELLFYTFWSQQQLFQLTLVRAGLQDDSESDLQTTAGSSSVYLHAVMLYLFACFYANI